MDSLSTNGINTLYGPNFATDVQNVCDAGEVGDYNCEYLQGLQAAYPDGRGEIGVRQLDHLA
jgi:hypothetical protein